MGEKMERNRREGFPRWGFALVALLLLMLGANGSMVWLSSRGHRDLVRSDYYDAGLDQDGIMARNGMARLPGMHVTLHRDGKAWRAESGSGLLRGAVCKIRLYRPDDGREDKVLNLGASRPMADAAGRIAWVAPSAVLRRGFWIAQLVWEENGKSIMEESFRIYVEG